MANCALVLGGHINGLSIVRELYQKQVQNIWLIDSKRTIATRSNKIIGFSIINKDSSSLLAEIKKLGNKFSRIIVFPTNDNYLEWMIEIHDEICDFCFIPFNPKTIKNSLSKYIQYEYCEKLGIPYPRTIRIKSRNDIQFLEAFELPLLIKPSKRDDILYDVFRSKLITSEKELVDVKGLVLTHISHGVEFIASELIPGDDTNIFAYTAYRNKKGEIINEWRGKKLTQYPDKFGVFSSAVNIAPEIISQQGRILLNELDIYGIAEPEFKFDNRDGKYKLTEINLRSMMWHRLGNLSGVYLQSTQWLDATEQPIPRQQQEFSKEIHFIYMKHEILNLFFRKGYWKHFKNNVFGGEERYFAVFMKDDIKPFLFDLFFTLKTLISKCLRA
jgi:predicted ATP-grasp superfamily ATP-dependent carboligase